MGLNGECHGTTAEPLRNDRYHPKTCHIFLTWAYIFPHIFQWVNTVVVQSQAASKHCTHTAWLSVQLLIQYVYCRTGGAGVQRDPIQCGFLWCATEVEQLQTTLNHKCVKDYSSTWLLVSHQQETHTVIQPSALCVQFMKACPISISTCSSSRG